MYKDATIEEIDVVMQQAWKAFHAYRKLSLKQRAEFMRAIAVELESCGDECAFEGDAEDVSDDAVGVGRTEPTDHVAVEHGGVPIEDRAEARRFGE